MNKDTTTLDGLLNRRVQLEQPADGYRVAVDTVFLAAAVPVHAGQRVLDIGCGVGGAMLCVACRVAGLSGVGIDIQPELIELCQRNMTRNAFAAGLVARVADVAALPAELVGAFDQVMMNPPYHEEARHDVSANTIKRTANAEKDGDLAVWIAAAGAALKDCGGAAIIHRADRLDEILGLLRGAFGEVEVLALVPKAGAAAKRVIVRARKGAVWRVRECSPLVLHADGGGYTEAAEKILRHSGVVHFN